MKDFIKNQPQAVAVAVAVLGFLFLFMGWNGAAGLDFVSGQIPYLLSGGFIGIGLIGSGLALAVIQSHRKDTQDLLAKLDEIADKMGATSAVAGLTEVPAGEMVIAGRSTYHRTDCHLVEHRDDLQPMSPAAAEERGLTPCRICKPVAAAS
jgi:hypothetical protein